MTSRNSTGDRGNKSSFREKKVMRANSNEKKISHSKDGFFIKPSNRNKKNIASDVAVNRKHKPVAIRKEFSQKKEKDIEPTVDTVESEKKTFDKKAWRIKRYSNKHKLQQWKDVRKTNLMREYNKSKKRSNTTPFNFDETEKYMNHSETSTQEGTTGEEGTSLLNDSDNTTNTEGKSTNLEQNLVSKRTKLLNKANQEDHERKNELTESQKRKAAKQEAIKEYKRKKMEKYKKLSRKTKKGQPVMKDRIEVLLEEIQNSMRQ